MATEGKGTFEVTSFEEEKAEQLDGGTKLSRARNVQAMSGDLDGELATDFLMYYSEDGTASIVGFGRFTGQVGDRKGSFVHRLTGGYDGAEVKGNVTVVPGSGTGALAKFTGRGTTTLPHGTSGRYTFTYEVG